MLNSISLKRRFWVSLVLLWTVIIFCTIIGVKGLLDARNNLQLIHNDKMTTVELLQELLSSFEDTRSHVFRAFQHDPSHDLHLLHDHEVSLHLNAIKDNQSRNRILRERLNNRPVDTVESGLRDNINNALNAWRAQLDSVTANIARNNYSNNVMFTFLTAGTHEGERVHQTIKELANYQSHQADLAYQQTEKNYQLSLLFLALLYVFFALPASVFMVLSLRRLDHGITQVEAAADSITHGDLTYEITLSGNDEMTHVKQKIRDMQAHLTRLIDGIRESSASIENDISQLSDVSRTLVDRNVQQSASLEQTSSATEELNSTVEQNASNAQQAEQTAQKANQAAIDGGQAVNGVVTIMQEIRDASERINNIVGIIDSIAFQTNILALNAAVEAARAGEQGRGFAVVASEVRALAQRSASAAGDIRVLVEKTAEVIQNGAEQTDHTGETMESIVANNAQLASLISEISHASTEQAVGLNEINQAMMSMDQANHQNNELANNTDVITQNLHVQSQQLLDLISSFKTHDQGVLDSQQRRAYTALK